jgi:hypothetical protein
VVSEISTRANRNATWHLIPLPLPDGSMHHICWDEVQLFNSPLSFVPLHSLLHPAGGLPVARSILPAGITLSIQQPTSSCARLKSARSPSVNCIKNVSSFSVILVSISVRSPRTLSCPIRQSRIASSRPALLLRQRLPVSHRSSALVLAPPLSAPLPLPLATLALDFHPPCPPSSTAGVRGGTSLE